MIAVNYPDSVNLSAFVDFVSQNLDIKIIYGDEVRNQTVVFRPGEVEVPKEHLLDLLRSMLRMSALALVEGDVDGWLRIVRTKELQRHVRDIRKAAGTEDPSSNRIVTQVVPIASRNMAGIVKHLRAFLSSPQASVIEVPDRAVVIITDYESAIARALEIVSLLDTTPVPVETETVTVRHYDPKILAERVTKLLTDKAKLNGVRKPPATMYPNSEAGTIVLLGTDATVGEAKELIQRFDVETNETRMSVTYTPKHMSADRLRRLVEKVLAPDLAAQGALRLFLDEGANRLYVTAPQEVHAKIERLLLTEDVKSAESTRPIRIYRPKNRLASDLIGVLSQILPNVLASTSVEARRRASGRRVPPGRNRPPGPRGSGQPLPMPPAQVPIESEGSPSSQVTRVEGQDFVMTYDEHTNSIIAIGPREFHSRLDELLKTLDVRQPQAVIEMTLVAITFNDSLSLGIELANEESNGGFQSLLFSSFGLSSINLATGSRTLNPGGGLNGIITGPFETPILLRAIAAHGDSRVMATPKTIVSNNTAATISSVEESPFTSVNASDTVATTSFAGFASAGTTLTVTPHIAQGDYLTLDYSLNFSNFTGSGSGGVPPPRTTNTFSGTVEIPDAHTIIVGGLVTENEADSVTEVPLLGRIPGVGVLFQSSERVRSKTRIYAFIRATILRDDQFEDLKIISQNELKRASVVNRDYPDDIYLWMR